MTSVTAAGLVQTCNQFVMNDEGATCAKIFADGFFEGDLMGVSKSLTSASAFVGAGFVVVLGWFGLIILLIKSLKQTSQVKDAKSLEEMSHILA